LKVWRESEEAIRTKSNKCMAAMLSLYLHVKSVGISLINRRVTRLERGSVLEERGFGV
jgi:hypothetical protein